MLAMIGFDYDAMETFKKLNREAYNDLRNNIGQLNLSEWKEEKEEMPYPYLHGEYLIDLSDDGALLAKYQIQFIIKRFKGAYKYASHPEKGHVQNILQVAIPAVGLLAMNEVELLDNACTDRLQSYLDDGWRIIAICPPDAQRRPDYILGRSPEMKKTSN